jgi:DNA-binding NarL/FixJ family response regulator
MDEAAHETLRRIDQTLTGILKALLTEQVKTIRSDERLSQIYDMTGTGKAVSEIAKKAKVSTGTVSGIWKSWEDSGLIIKSGKSYRKITDRSGSE